MFKKWKSITIGGTTRSKLREALEKKGISISSYANDLLMKMKVQKNKEIIDLVKVTVKELGCTEYPTTEELYARAQERGLELCPAEVGPALRLVLHQELYEYCYVGMKPIAGAGGGPHVFGLARDSDGLWLSGTWAGPRNTWGLDRSFVFRFRTDAQALVPSEMSDPLILRRLENVEQNVAKILAWIEKGVQ